ncbi:MAG: hypothetical protein RL701_5918 [Pseudomonadota bacterium]|jgi:hypothetical protein
MSGRAQHLFQRIVTKAKRGHRGDPVGTVAFYGPSNEHASKVVVGISPSRHSGVTELRKWLSIPQNVNAGEDKTVEPTHEQKPAADAEDVRNNVKVLEEVLTFLSTQGVKSVVVTNGVYGCPHEEGSDYPEGESCQQCSFWIDRVRDVPIIGGVS